MQFKSITEDESIKFASELLDYFKNIDDNSINHILTSHDVDSLRDNTGWYNHIGDKHNIFINIPNILCLKEVVEKKKLSIDDYYAFLTLCISHEFRHFLQGRCIYEGIDADGYSQDDVLKTDLMLYIRFFFDGYYLMNKADIKYELDAEKFAVAKGMEYLKTKFPSMDVEKSMTNAIRFYAKLQSYGGFMSTLPPNCMTTQEVLEKLNARLDNNGRISDLRKTLFVYSPRFYTTHLDYGLDDEGIIDDELLEKYRNEKDGAKRDLLVVNRILELLEKPLESLEQFPNLQKKYVSNDLKL